MPPSPPLQRVSRRAEVAEIIRDRIRSRQWVNGDRLPSFAEMRAEFGTSPSTVDRIYSILEEEGMVRRRNGVGIFVAGPPRRVETGLIGFILDDDPYVRHSLYWMSLVEGAREAAEAAGRNLVLMPWEPAQLNRVDGALLTSSRLRPLPLGVPVVTLIEHSADRPSVIADEATGIAEVMQHLLWLGHRRIGYLCGTCAGHNAPDSRLGAYRLALQEAGIAIEPSWIRPLSNSDGAGRELREFEKKAVFSMESWLRDNPTLAGCTALLCQNDHAAIGAIEVLQGAGLRVPDDVSVVGFDGTEFSRLVTPKLTTVEIPLQAMGKRGMELLLQLIASQDKGADIAEPVERFPVRVRVRASTGPVKRIS